MGAENWMSRAFHPHFSPFRVFLAREQRLALVLNPKVGSTFLRQLLAAGFIEQLGRADPSDGRYGPLKMARNMPLAPMRDYWDFLRAPQSYAVHAIVRNPYARVVSAWRDKFLDGHMATPDGAVSGYPRSIRGGVLRRARAVAQARGLEGAEAGSLVPFETFLTMVEAERPGRRNSHWDAQWRVLQTDVLPFTGFLRIEDGLGEPLADLLAPLRFDRDWVLARAERPANPSSKAKAPVLDAALAARVQRLYARDFELFGYDPDGWEGR